MALITYALDLSTFSICETDSARSVAEIKFVEGLSSLPQSTTGKFLQRQNVQRTVQSDGVVQSNPVHIRPRLAQTPLPLR
jgi:hypothetical protein